MGCTGHHHGPTSTASAVKAALYTRSMISGANLRGWQGQKCRTYVFNPLRALHISRCTLNRPNRLQVSFLEISRGVEGVNLGIRLHNPDSLFVKSPYLSETVPCDDHWFGQCDEAVQSRVLRHTGIFLHFHVSIIQALYNMMKYYVEVYSLVNLKS